MFEIKRRPSVEIKGGIGSLLSFCCTLINSPGALFVVWHTRLMLAEADSGKFEPKRNVLVLIL